MPLPPPPPRYNVLGVGVSALTLESARDLVLDVRGRLRRGYICLATVNGITEARRQPAVRAAFNGSWLTTPDGMPMVWLGHWHGHRGVTRVYGPDLMLAVCDAGRGCGLRHYFLGGLPGVAPRLAAALQARFPGLDVAGTHTPPFRELTPGEFSRLQAEIARVRPDVVWVGLGSPKQELFMAGAWERLDAGVLVGVGAAFDFHSGRVAQAPRWMQRSGFEWLFRLATDPRRLWRRYLLYNPLFVARTAAQLSGLRRYPLD